MTTPTPEQKPETAKCTCQPTEHGEHFWPCPLHPMECTTPETTAPATASDTPRTDAKLEDEKKNPRMSGLGYWRYLAQDLERELNEAKREKAELREALGIVSTYIPAFTGAIEDSRVNEGRTTWIFDYLRAKLHATKGAE